MADVLVLAAHPQFESSRVNRALAQAAAALGERQVELRDLYALYPDYLIDVEAEQAALARARLVVWQHPIHWYSMPPLMKLWVDEVLAFGWAYGPGGTALKGKDLWLVAVDRRAPRIRTTPAATTATSSTPSCRPTSRPPRCAECASCRRCVLHGAHRVGDDELAAHARLYASRLLSHPHWPELADMETPAGLRRARRGAPRGRLNRPWTTAPG